MPRITAVIPTFNPEPALLGRLDGLLTQVDRVVVVDDGSSSLPADLADAIAARATLIRSERNLGIAAALNSGCREALRHGADFVLTLDQDTELPPDYLAHAMRVFSSASPTTRIGIVCPDRINDAPSIPPRFSPEGFGLVDEAIQSGLVIAAEVLETVGEFETALFIDCVDIEFCLRARDQGFRIAVIPDSRIVHELGSRQPLRGVSRRLAGGDETYEYHSPYRRYFMARNNVVLMLRYARKRPRWTLSAIRRELRPAGLAVLAGPHRFRQAVAILAGATAGLTGRTGAMPRRMKRLLS